MSKETNMATGTSVFSMILVLISSACCVGPLAVALSFIGLGGTTMLALENVFGPYRAIILTVTALFLGAGFYLAYKPVHEPCEDGKICAQPRSRLIQRILLWFATAFLAVLLYFTYVHPNLDLWFDIY